MRRNPGATPLFVGALIAVAAVALGAPPAPQGRSEDLIEVLFARAEVLDRTDRLAALPLFSRLIAELENPDVETLPAEKRALLAYSYFYRARARLEIGGPLPDAREVARMMELGETKIDFVGLARDQHDDIRLTQGLHRPQQLLYPFPPGQAPIQQYDECVGRNPAVFSCRARKFHIRDFANIGNQADFFCSFKVLLQAVIPEGLVDDHEPFKAINRQQSPGQ